MIILLVALLSLTFPTFLPGATFIVTKTTDDNGPCSVADCALREAILAANALPGADTVAISPGTYALTLAGPGEDLGLSGDLDIRDDLEVSGDPLDPPTIVGDGLDRVLHINSSAVGLSALTLTGGGGNGPGGGIFAFAS
ncbi:MAG: CSLREA domain-containing protein, partial [Actinomycetia bacterium]|nr:CSLREA domain-containing protein [Actinomycetes bacterium]